MAKEIELKLALSPYHINSLLQQPLFHQLEVEPLGKQLLHNCYFDTAEKALNQSRVALRIRQQGERFIQTLKTKGIAQAGLHQRNEWEWDLTNHQLDTSLLSDTAWSDVFEQPPSAEQLIPVFNTDFERQLWMYRSWDEHGAPIEIEIALDSGEVWVDIEGQRRSDPLSELELELKQGEPQHLFDLALVLARHVPLQICDISKAERGYRLFDPQAYQVNLTRPVCEPNMSLEQTYSTLMQFELQHWPRQLEAWQFSHKWEHGSQALDSLRNIRALREHFNDVAPAPANDELELLLERFTDRLRSQLSWRRCSRLIGVNGAGWTRQSAETATNRIAVLSQTVEAGLIGLLLGQQLSKQSWRLYWQEAHQARAQQTLSEL